MIQCADPLIRVFYMLWIHSPILLSWLWICTKFCGSSTSHHTISTTDLTTRLAWWLLMVWCIVTRRVASIVVAPPSPFFIWFPFHCRVSAVAHLSLPHWGRNKMTAIFQTTFSHDFFLMKRREFRLRFHWRLFLGVQSTLFRQCIDNGLAPVRRQAIIWTNDGLVYWHKHASLGLNELRPKPYATSKNLRCR